MLLYYISVLYRTSIGGRRSQCNNYCTHANVKTYRTIFCKALKVTNFTKLFNTSGIQQNQLGVQKMLGNKK